MGHSLRRGRRVRCHLRAQKWQRMWWWSAARASHGPRPATARLCQSVRTRSCLTLSSRWRKLGPPIGASFRPHAPCRISQAKLGTNFRTRDGPRPVHVSSFLRVVRARTSSDNARTHADEPVDSCLGTRRRLSEGLVIRESSCSDSRSSSCGRGRNHGGEHEQIGTTV